MAFDVARSLDSFPDILHPGLPRISSASTRLPVFLATAAWKCWRYLEGRPGRPSTGSLAWYSTSSSTATPRCNRHGKGQFLQALDLLLNTSCLTAAFLHLPPSSWGLSSKTDCLLQLLPLTSSKHSSNPLRLHWCSQCMQHGSLYPREQLGARQSCSSLLSTACFAFCWFWVVVCFALSSSPVWLPVVIVVEVPIASRTCKFVVPLGNIVIQFFWP